MSFAHIFWIASGIPWQMKSALIDWAAGTQPCKYLLKHLYLINSSLFIKLSDGKPIWHLVLNLYSHLLETSSNHCWRENLHGCQCNF